MCCCIFGQFISGSGKGNLAVQGQDVECSVQVSQTLPHLILERAGLPCNQGSHHIRPNSLTHTSVSVLSSNMLVDYSLLQQSAPQHFARL